MPLSKSFKQVLDANRGVGPAFDLLRVLLAGAIFYGHAKWLSGQDLYTGPLGAPGLPAEHAGGWEGWKRPLQVALAPAFFALSGFLVTGSALRTRVTATFLAYRALRIFPALIVEVTLSAILFGVWLSDLPAAAYFADPGFWRYLGNIVGWVTFWLPGVFTDNPVPGIVNANLWTLPSEFDCYLVTAVLMVSGVIYRRRAMTWLFAAVSAVFVVLNGLTDFAVTRTVMAGIAVTYYFFVGVLFFHWRERIPVSWPLFLVSGAIGYAALTSHHAVFLAAPFVTYCTLFFGLLPIPKIGLISSGDYSYGIYLYGFPITQAAAATIPGLAGNGWLTLGVSAMLTFTFAALSWHLVEKHALRLKNRLPARFFPKSRPAAAAPARQAASGTHG